MGESPVRESLHSGLMQSKPNVLELGNENTENLNANSPIKKRKRGEGFDTPSSKSQKRLKEQSPCSKYMTSRPDRRTAEERAADKAIYEREDRMLEALLRAEEIAQSSREKLEKRETCPISFNYFELFTPVTSEIPLEHRCIEKGPKENKKNIEDDKDIFLTTSSNDEERLALSTAHSSLSPREQQNFETVEAADGEITHVSETFFNDTADAEITHVSETSFSDTADAEITHVSETSFSDTADAEITHVSETSFSDTADGEITDISETSFSDTVDAEIPHVSEISFSDTVDAEIPHVSETEEDEFDPIDDSSADEVKNKRAFVRGKSEPLHFVPGDHFFLPRGCYPGEDPNDPIEIFSEAEETVSQPSVSNENFSTDEESFSQPSVPVISEEYHKSHNSKDLFTDSSSSDKENTIENGRTLSNEFSDSGEKIQTEIKKAVLQSKRKEWDIIMVSFFPSQKEGKTIQKTDKITDQGVFSTYTSMKW